MRLRNINQSGDTIVEVMIAIIVVGSVLVTAFQITDRNTKAMLQAQEYSQATQLVQSQVEFLRNGDFRPANHRCFRVDGTPTAAVAECAVNAAGTPTTDEPKFELVITQPSANLYLVSATWQNATGVGQGNVTVRYKL